MTDERSLSPFRLEVGDKRVEREADAEIEFHLAMRTRKLAAEGRGIRALAGALFSHEQVDTAVKPDGGGMQHHVIHEKQDLVEDDREVHSQLETGDPGPEDDEANLDRRGVEPHLGPKHFGEDGGAPTRPAEPHPAGPERTVGIVASRGWGSRVRCPAASLMPSISSFSTQNQLLELTERRYDRPFIDGALRTGLVSARRGFGG